MNKKKFKRIAIYGKFYKEACKLFDKYAKKGAKRTTEKEA